MKSQVSFLLDKIKKEGKKLTETDIADIAYEFQEATIETLAKRLIKIAKEQEAKTVAIAGGVSANNRLVEYLTNSLKFFPKFLSPIKKVYSTDNAAMIGVVGLLTFNNVL
jgi:N6-L-threonylcarbamoyladenine synthase